MLSLVELFELSTNICARCGNRIDEVAAAAKPINVTETPPPQQNKTGNSLLGFVEYCTGKITDSIGLIGLIKHLRVYGGDGVLVSDVDDKFYDGFIEYLKTAKKSLNPSIGNVISDTYQKRMKECFDEVLTLTKEKATA